MQVGAIDPHLKPTLAELGIDKHLATRARKLAALSDEAFEAALGEAVERRINPRKRTRGSRVSTEADRT
jgi:hypothetical protein